MLCGAWNAFCGNPKCSQQPGNKFTCDFSNLLNPYSCVNHAFIISIDILLLSIFLFIFIHKSCTRKIRIPSQSLCISIWLFLSAMFCVVLGLAYFGFGAWIIYKKLAREHFALPLHSWIVMLFQGFTWLMLGLWMSIKKLHASYIRAMKFSAVIFFFLSGFLSISSLWEAILVKSVTGDTVLNILCFPGSIFLLSYSVRAQQHIEDEDPEINNGGSYTSLPTSEASSDHNVTQFERAGFFNGMSFWWLNSVLKKGKEKILEDEDIPQLRKLDEAETCFSVYAKKLGQQKHEESSETPTLLSIILTSHKRAILVSGFFAFIKVLTLSTGPLFLKAFIRVAEGNEGFKYEGYVLTIGLLLVKCLESLSERQWYFRTRLIGLQVRSMLFAAIYRKQLLLSNASKMSHSPGQIVNYVTVDAYRIGEFSFWFHQIWSTCLQLCFALAIVYYSMRIATVAAIVAVMLTVLASSPLVKLQHKYQTKFMMAQDKRLMTTTEAFANMKILKLYAWETHFKSLIEGLRTEESKCMLQIMLQRGYNIVLFWSSPIFVSAITFWTCYILGISLTTPNVFTFLASLRILQEPVRLIPDVAGAFIEAKVSLSRIVRFLDAQELENRHRRQECSYTQLNYSIFIRSTEISWENTSSLKATLRNINLTVKPGEKVAICGEVGSGKSTLLAAVLGEVPKISGVVNVHGKIAYVSQTAWIQTGTIQENILFGSVMDPIKYHKVLEKCCLVKDLEMLPYGDQTGIGERGVNLSGGQKQRIQLARALYQDADIYLLDDPFSAVDAHTATSLFNEYVMGALSGKTVLLVTHQVDFLPALNSILLMHGGEIVKAATYNELLASSQEFQDLVNAHNKINTQKHVDPTAGVRFTTSKKEIPNTREQFEAPPGDQLIKQEERETGDTGLKPYLQYLHQSNGFICFTLAIVLHMIFIVGQMLQTYLFAVDLHNSHVSKSKLLIVYSVIGCVLAIFLLLRSFSIVSLGSGAAKSIFAKLLSSLFRAPMSFYDSTPLGRILSRVSSDLSIVDNEVAFKLILTFGTTMNTYSSFLILAVLTWPVLFVILPMFYLSVVLQRYYSASAKELMRITGTTKSAVASNLAEAISGAMTIRAFGEEERFFSKHLEVIDANARPDFYNFSANEWLIQRLEMLCAIVLSSATLAMTLLPLGSASSGFVGMALSYGLSLNVFLVSSVQFQCLLANLIVSIERLEQYMHIPSEAPEVIESSRPLHNWPSAGKVEIYNLQVRYRPDAPLVLQGISCIFEGGQKIGIVGRTGSGKSSLIASLFRLVEPADGKIFIDDLNVFTIGLHDLRSHLGIIPQDPTLFSGSVRYNLDPLSQHSDREIWEVLGKCQLQEVVKEKGEGLDSVVVQDGSNWSMGQRQLFCLGRALLKRSKILVLDEATASMDNQTDMILQRSIRTEFEESTVITVAHRIPTVMDCDMVLGISDGKLIEFDEPLKLMSREGSLFGQLVKEYWSHNANAC